MYRNKYFRVSFPVALCAMWLAAFTAAGSPPRQLSHRDSVFIKTIRLKLEAGAEYMVPYDAGRQITTVSANIYGGVQFFRNVHLSVLGGLTASYAWGNIIQLNGNLQNFTLQTAAFGLGPGFLLRFEPIIAGRFSISLDVSVAILFYSRNFPAGGDIYNFMSRLGGSVCYRIDRRNKLAFSGRWMHVSNGQGFNEHNPSYPAAGAGISLIHYF